MTTHRKQDIVASLRRLTYAPRLAFGALLAASVAACSGSTSGPGSVADQSSAVQFQAAGSYDVSTASSLASSDWNGDGKADIAAGSDDGTVTILTNRGAGKLEATQHFSLDGSVSAVAAADLRHEGHADVLAVTRDRAGGAGHVQIIHGAGDGSFALGSSYVVGASPSAVTTVDLDGDGHLDVVVCNQGSGTITVLLGQGDGSLRSAYHLSLSARPLAIAVSDVDGDGHADLLVRAVGAGEGHVILLFGDGHGRVRSAALVGADGTLSVDAASGLDLGDGTNVPLLPGGAIDLVADGRASAATADFDGDGKIDFAIGSENPVSASLGAGNITVLASRKASLVSTSSIRLDQQSATAVTAGDFDGDGKLDLVAGIAEVKAAGQGGDHVGLLRGKGDGSFEAMADTQLSVRSPSAVVATDLDGDGRADLAVASSIGSSLTVLLSTRVAASAK